MNDEGAALHRTPAHRDELYGESCETEASKRSGKQGKQQKERCSGHPWTDPKCGSDRFEPETDGENEFMKGPKEGENSIQDCFMRLMNCCVSANYKRFLGIGIHPGQLGFVKAISEHEGISQRELAEGLHVKPPTVAVAAKRLEKADVVYRRPDPKDHRISRLYLQEKGKRIAEEMLWNIRQNEQMLTEGFSGEELDQLREYFRRMTENMERFAQESEIAAEAEACQKLPEGGAKKKERK